MSNDKTPTFTYAQDGFSASNILKEMRNSQSAINILTVSSGGIQKGQSAANIINRPGKSSGSTDGNSGNNNSK